MEKEKLIIRNYLKGNDSDPFFYNENSPIVITEYTCSKPRMGVVPNLTAKLMFAECLDDHWDGKQWVTFQGEKYFIFKTPSSSKSNTESRYKHDIQFHSERNILNGVYLFDVVDENNPNDRYITNSSEFMFYGDIKEFSDKLNVSAKYSGIAYSFVVDADITSERKQISFNNVYLSDALTLEFENYEIPFYFVGNVCHFGFTSNAVTQKFEYGQENELLSISKTNANYKIVASCTGTGSSENLPHYYPNKNDEDRTFPRINKLMPSIYRKTLGKERFYKAINDMYYSENKPNIVEYSIEDFRQDMINLSQEGDPTIINHGSHSSIKFRSTKAKFDKYNKDCVYAKGKFKKGSHTICFTGYAGYSEEHNVKVAAGFEIWFTDGTNEHDVVKTFNVNGERIRYVSPSEKTIDSIRLANPIANPIANTIVEIDGLEIIEGDNDNFYEFENIYTDLNPRQHTVQFEDIKPTIKGMTNANGEIIGEFIDFAYDKDDSDEVGKDGNYIHSYFYAKLRIFDGDNSFNIFDSAIAQDNMSIVFQSGKLAPSEFEIGVSRIAVSEGVEKFINPVQVDSNGDIVSGSYKDKVDVNNPIERQQDTSKHSVWIALKKNENTFGVVMPNVTNNFKPSIGDGFALLNINLPQAYITAAENRLEQSIIHYLVNNNSDKFNFSIIFSSIFLANNESIFNQINDNARLIVRYNDKDYSFYVNNYTYKATDKSPLPQIEVQLTDTLTINKNAIDKAVGGIKSDIMNSVGSIDFLKQGLKYFLRKDVDDRARGIISSDNGFEVGKYKSGAFGYGGYYGIDKDGKSFAEIDRLYVRLKAYFDVLEINKIQASKGNRLASNAAITCTNVEILKDSYRCYFINKEDDLIISNDFIVNDQAICKEFNIKSSDTHGVSNRYYWRLVVGTGDDYIDLSKTDADTNSDIPKIGDNIVQLGNRVEETRQNAIMESTSGTNAPSYTLYQGIYNYSFEDKEMISLGFNAANHKAFLNVKGDAFIGIDDIDNFIKLDTEKKLLEISAHVNIKGGKAREELDNLQNILDKVNDDGIVSKNERFALKQELSVIESKDREIQKNIIRYDVVGKKIIDNYNQSYKEYQEMITSMSVESESDVSVPDTYDSVRATFYESLTNIGNLINSKIKEYNENNVEQSIDNIKIGGANLLPNSMPSSHDIDDTLSNHLGDNYVIYYSSRVTHHEHGVFEIDSQGIGSETKDIVLGKNILPMPFTEYVISFYAKADISVDMVFRFGGGIKSDSVSINTEWNLYSVYIKSGEKPQPCFFYITPATFVRISEIMYEKGNKPTSWSESNQDLNAKLEDFDAKLEDFDYITDAIENGETDISGGLILSNILMLKNKNKQITAGINGFNNQVNGLDPAIWLGGDIDAAKTEDVIALFRHNGSGFLGNKKIWWDNLGKMGVGIFNVTDDSITVDTENGMKIRITNKSINELDLIKDTNFGFDINKRWETEYPKNHGDWSYTYPLKSGTNNFYEFKNIYLSANAYPSSGEISGNASAKIEISIKQGAAKDILLQEEVHSGPNTNMLYKDIITGNKEVLSDFAASITLRIYEIHTNSGAVIFQMGSYAVGDENEFYGCVIAKDGLLISSGRSKRFLIKPDKENLEIIQDLPPYSKDLKIGQLYVDDGGFIRQKMYKDEDNLHVSTLKLNSPSFLTNDLPRQTLDLSEFYDVKINSINGKSV